MDIESNYQEELRQIEKEKPLPDADCKLSIQYAVEKAGDLTRDWP